MLAEFAILQSIKSDNQKNDDSSSDEKNCIEVIGVEGLRPRKFCVVLHDVAAVFASELDLIVRQVKDLVDGNFSCAVVPQWHGHIDPAGLAKAVSICGDCSEWMIHGMTHQRQTGGGLVSWLTAAADEFGGLKRAEIQERLLVSQQNIQTVTGSRPVGLVAPCWNLPVNAESLTGIDYVMGYNRLQPCFQDADSVSGARREKLAEPRKVVRLATWSYDWGRLGSVASLVNCYPASRLRWTHDISPCVVIHPADVRRGWLPVAAQRIHKLLSLGYQSVTPCELLFGESQTTKRHPAESVRAL